MEKSCPAESDAVTLRQDRSPMVLRMKGCSPESMRLLEPYLVVRRTGAYAARRRRFHTPRESSSVRHPWGHKQNPREERSASECPTSARSRPEYHPHPGNRYPPEHSDRLC